MHCNTYTWCKENKSMKSKFIFNVCEGLKIFRLKNTKFKIQGYIGHLFSLYHKIENHLVFCHFVYSVPWK